MNALKRQPVLIALTLLIAAAWKTWLLWLDVIPFNADEAVVALMARHIRLGARPIFFYGQAYMGSLDAYLVAIGFAAFGEQVWVVRLIQALLYLAIIITTLRLAQEVLANRQNALLAGALLTIPTVNVTLYTTASLGGYGEALLLGNLILLSALSIRRRWQAAHPAWLAMLAWGFFSGLGLWANGLTLIYTLPAAAYLIFFNISRWRQTRFAGEFLPWLAALVGLLVGATPWWLYAMQSGIHSLLAELSGSAVAVEQNGWALRSINHLVSLLLLGIPAIAGFRPPWAVQWLALPLLPFVGMFWSVALLIWVRRIANRQHPRRAEFALLAGVTLTLIAGFVFTPFGIDPSGRYFLPLAVPLSILAAETIAAATQRFGRWRWALAALIIVYQAAGTIQCALQYPPGLTTQFYEPSIVDHRYDQELIRFLQEKDERYGYTTYWVAYPLAFHSKENLIYAPRLSYHPDLSYTRRDDRYPPYNEPVRHSPHPAYITARNPNLDRVLRRELQRTGLTWQEHTIGDYHIFYALSAPVHPEDLRLEANAAP